MTEEPRAGARRFDRIRWHEEQAGELVREREDGHGELRPASAADVERAKVHVALAISLRLAEVTEVLASRLRR